MAVSFLKSFQVQHGTLVDASAETEEELYVSPAELNQLYGCQVTEADIRAAMSLIAAHCNRPSLWPVEYDSGPIELPPDRQETRLPVMPVIAIVDAAGRYGMGRRDRRSWNGYAAGVAAYLVIAGSRPQWTPIDVSNIELDSGTGIAWVPYNFLLAPWQFLKFKFVAGLIEIPPRVKLSIFELVTSMHARGVSDRQRYSVGKVSRSYASDSFITPQAKQLLSPYVVQSLF